MHRFPLLALVLFAAPAFAQDALDFSSDAPRVLHTVVTEVKGPDGTPAMYRYTTTYDPARGEYVRTVEDEASGATVKREVLPSIMRGPTPEEAEAAQRLIIADAELAALIGAAEYPVEVVGGFPLVREAAAGFCGPGTRCMQFDILEMVPDQRAARRIRFVVVDMRRGEVVARDLDPELQGNLANPAIRTDSRARGLAFPSDSQ